MDMSAFLAKEIQNQEVWVGRTLSLHCLASPLGHLREASATPWGHIIFVCLLALTHAAFRVFIPPAGTEPLLPALGAWSHNRSTTREVPEVALASVFSAILPSPPEDPVLWAHQAWMLTKRDFLLGPLLFKKNEPRVPVVSWYLLIYSAAYFC